MSVVDFILVGSVGLLTLAGYGYFWVVRTRFERVENAVNDTQKTIAALPTANGLPEVSAELVELHRKLTELQTISDNHQLRLTDLHDTVEHRYNRLRMRQTRARQEGEEETEPEDTAAAQQLLMELNGADQVAQEQPAPMRGRLVRKTSRRPYGR